MVSHSCLSTKDFIRYHECLPLVMNTHGEVVGTLGPTTASARSVGGQEASLINADAKGQ